MVENNVTISERDIQKTRDYIIYVRLVLSHVDIDKIRLKDNILEIGEHIEIRHITHMLDLADEILAGALPTQIEQKIPQKCHGDGGKKMTKIETILSEKEEVLLRLPFDIFSICGHSAMYVTNRQIIFIKPSFFGTNDYIKNMNFRDVSGVEVRDGLISAEVHIKTRFSNKEIILHDVHKETSKKVVRYVQDGIEKNP